MTACVHVNMESSERLTEGYSITINNQQNLLMHLLKVLVMNQSSFAALYLTVYLIVFPITPFSSTLNDLVLVATSFIMYVVVSLPYDIEDRWCPQLLSLRDTVHCNLWGKKLNTSKVRTMGISRSMTQFPLQHDIDVSDVSMYWCEIVSW